MATSSIDRLAALRARAAARGYELLRDDSGDEDRFYALDVKDRILAELPMTIAGLAEWLDSAEADDREAAKANGAEIEHEIARDIDDATLTLAQNDLAEQAGAAEKLPAIATLARELATALNDLCGTAHTTRPDAKPEHNGDDSESLDRAITLVLNSLHTIYQLSDMLLDDAIRDDGDRVLAIGNALTQLADTERNRLDRPGGWKA